MTPTDISGTPSPADRREESQPLDQIFLDRMIHHHRGAIGMARVASQRAEHAELDALADQTVAEHRAELDQMMAWRIAWYGDPTRPPTRIHDEDLATTIARDDQRAAEQVRALEQANPFDLAFIDAMIAHHQKALAMSQDAIRHAKREEVRSLASLIVKDRTKEIAAMEELRAMWYPTVQAAKLGE